MEEPKREIGRNEPCPCGSGRKYKRCCGASAAPKVSAPTTSAPASMPAGLDPSQIDPAWIAKFTQAMQRLPRGQVQRLQALMQKAMTGKDVSREAADLERTLPPDFKDLLLSFKGPGGEPMPGLAEPAPAAEMTPEEARRIVEAAAAQGTISPEQAQALLQAQSEAAGAAEPGASSAPEPEKDRSGLGKLWKRVSGK